jgi:N-acetylmuramate 1-kinase
LTQGVEDRAVSNCHRNAFLNTPLGRRFGPVAMASGVRPAKIKLVERTESVPLDSIRRMTGERWPGSGVEAVRPLSGDASSRRFWRVKLNGAHGTPASVVAVDLGPEDLPRYVVALGLLARAPQEPPYINVHRYLRAAGVAVPELYGWLPAERLLIVEDLGDVKLFEAALANAHAAATLYRLAIDELLRIHAASEPRRGDSCVAFSLAYDERLFRWELDEFLDYGSAELPHLDASRLRPELDQLAERLGRLPRVLSHRDYHGHNLLVEPGERIRVIDFQDALMAPRAQDLAVLLTTRDASRVINPALEKRLLNYYAAGVARRLGLQLDGEAFFGSYRLCVLQHALKVIGRFIRLERDGKSGYARYVPYAVSQARRMLSQQRGFSNLRRALEGAAEKDGGR